MIYLDNAATTLYKPQEVDAAILDALHTAGNPGRGAHEPTLHASRLVYAAREALAELFHAPDPACIAFTANATGALNTALCGLLGPERRVTFENTMLFWYYTVAQGLIALALVHSFPRLVG